LVVCIDPHDPYLRVIEAAVADDTPAAIKDYSPPHLPVMTSRCESDTW